MREVPQRLASPSEETPSKKISDKCINHFIQLNLELLNTGTVHSLGWWSIPYWGNLVCKGSAPLVGFDRIASLAVIKPLKSNTLQNIELWC